jgi:hypothetical protein
MSFYVDQAPQRDVYGRRAFARQFARLIGDIPHEASACLAITAPWGNGKSTALKYLREEVVARDRVQTLAFSPHLYIDHDLRVRGFFHALMPVAAAALPNAEAMRTEDGAEVLEPGDDGIYAPEPIRPVYEPQGDAQAGGGNGTGNGHASETPYDLLADDLLERARALMARLASRVVVFVDEVDRLGPDELLAFLRFIRMVADFPNLVYVVAFDRDLVVEALTEPLRTTNAASRFLEKVFQAELPLPWPDPGLLRGEIVAEVNRIMSEGIEPEFLVISEDDFRRFQVVLDRCLLERFRNLRVAKRFWNQLTTLLPVVKGNVNITDFVILEALRACDPDGYKALRERLSELVDRHEDDRDRYARHRDISQEVAKEMRIGNPMLFLDVMFPHVPDTDTTEIARLTGDLRVCTPRFAWRYFNYAVASTDIPTIATRGLIEGANLGEPQAHNLATLLHRYPSGQSLLFEDIAGFIELVEPRGADHLLAVVGDMLDTLSDGGEGITGSPLRAACDLCEALVHKVEFPSRPLAIEALLARTDSLVALSFFLGRFEPRAAMDPLVGRRDWDMICRKVTARVTELDRTTPLYEIATFGTARRLYRLLAHDDLKVETRERQLERFAADRGAALKFLLQFAGNGWGDDDRYPGNLDNGAYAELVDLLPADELAPILERCLTEAGINVADVTRPDAFPHRGDSPFKRSSAFDGHLQAAQFLWMTVMARAEQERRTSYG